MRSKCYLLMFAVWNASIAEAAVDFNRDIRPILSANCFRCHGPDEEARQADLRLDQRDDAILDRGGYQVISPGSIEQSEFIARILSDDPDVMMPPPSSNKSLTDTQRDLLRQWISEGAEYQEHWSFVPPSRPELPEVSKPDWCRNEIDYFILAALDNEAITPSMEADPYTLVRRVYLDLVGLPPTPDEADLWVARLTDTTSDPETAYLELVDSLLASPRYGERWARRWLDLARYADTNGYEKDRERSIWPFRDWVINAFNNDMPFDQFTIEQIAGDMLPDATTEQRIATGFHRNTMLNEEGGIDPLEFRFHAMTDRVATTGTTWLGLTLECCQCHTHKFDPITQREYYQFMAFLDNADEPDLILPDAEREVQYQQNLAEADRLTKELITAWPMAEGETDEQRAALIEERFQTWLTEQREATVEWQPLTPTELSSNLPLLTLEPDGHTVFASGDTTKLDRYELTMTIPVEGVTAIRLEALPDDRLPARGPGMTFYEGTIGDFFLGEFQISCDGQPIEIATASESYAKNRFGDHAVTAELATDGNVQTGWSVDGRIGERHWAVFNLAEPLPSGREVHLTMTFGRHFSSSLGKFRLSATTSRAEVQARDLPEDVEQLLSLNDSELSEEQHDQLMDAFLVQAPELKEAAERIHQLRRPLVGVTTLVMQERPATHPRPTFVHHRGEYLQATDQVQPGTPSALHSIPADAPRNRLTFAEWLVSRDNPFVARVFVNRQWSALFGAGLVRTVDDFGTQGDTPSHPELLDWLAVEFMDRGWSIKQLHRLLVTSSTYRQSSHVSPDRWHADPDNRWLSRASRFRLEAEIIRDSTLSAAGLLTERIGGPPVRPPQPEGVTEAAYGRPGWNASTGDDRYRRSVYTFIKRTAPFAMYNTFDAPSGEECIATRDVSNTPLQALTLLNDVMFLEAARALGDELSHLEATDSERAALAWRRVLTRPASDAELTRLLEFVEEQRSRMVTGELQPQVIMGIASDDETDSDPSIQGEEESLAESAAWTLAARALFSLDEAITRP